ncbi:MAG: MFS transporter [Actinomycetes bacterium]
MSGNREVLRNSAFRRLFWSRAISNVGNGVAPIALAFGVLALPGASPTSLSIVLAAQAIPLVLMLPFGGVIADRLGRARVIMVTDASVSVFVMTMAILFITGHANVPILAILGALSGLLNGMWYPAMSGLTPDVVPDEQLQSANALVSIATNVGFIAGNALGGVLVALVGPGWAIAIDSVSFVISAALIYSIRHVAKPHDSGESVLSDLIHGWRVFLSFRWIVVIVGCFSFVVMVWRGAEEVLGPVLALEIYGGPKGWALVMACQGVGLLVGGIVASRVRAGRPLVIGMLITLALPAWLLLLAAEVPLPVAAAGALAFGVALELFYVFWLTALQTRVPRESLSRVNSYDALGTMMFGPIGLALAGPLVAVIGLHTTFILGAVIAALAVAVSLMFRSVRQLTFAN